MPAYEYKALDARGKQKQGVVEADAPRAVRQQLREKGLDQPDDGDGGGERVVVLAAPSLIAEVASGVEDQPRLEVTIGMHLHLDDGAAAAVEHDAHVDDDGLVGGELAGDARVDDGEVIDRLGEDGFEHGSEQLLLANQQELDDEVDGGVE